MPIDVDFLSEHQILHITAYGDISPDNGESVMEQIRSNPNFQADRKILVEFTGKAKFPSLGRMKSFGQMFSDYLDMFKNDIALVVTKGNVTKASIVCMMVRAFGIRMEAYEDKSLALNFLITGKSWQK